MTAKVPEAAKKALQDIDLILSYLSNPEALADADGELIRAQLAEHGRNKLVQAQDALQLDDG